VTGAADRYDEELIRAGLDGLPDHRRAAFACAMAECLMPMTERSSPDTDRGDVVSLRRALDVAWSAAAGESLPVGEVEAASELAESLVPDDQDEDWTTLSALRQNAAAAVTYALWASLHHDPQDAVWAAREVYEAADYLVQLTAPEHSYYDSAGSVPVSLALEAIRDALRSVVGPTSYADLRVAARAAGVRLGDLLEQG
jgi:hypothetical protein